MSYIVKLIKQFLCNHEDITTTTETNLESPILIVRSLIQCSQCKKTFAQHPNAQCCYIYHIHHEIMQEKIIQQYKAGNQGYSTSTLRT